MSGLPFQLLLPHKPGTIYLADFWPNARNTCSKHWTFYMFLYCNHQTCMQSATAGEEKIGQASSPEFTYIC